MLIIKVFFLIFLFFLFPSSCFSSSNVLINEFSSKSDPEWVEIYNSSSTETIDLANWQIVDGNSLADDLDLSGTIDPLSFRAFDHDKGWLNDSGDTITLKDNLGKTVGEVIVYGSGEVVIAPAADKSASCYPDGSENWFTLSSLTKGKPNSSPPPSPSPSPSPNPSPKSSPSPSSSPSDSEEEPQSSPISSPSLSIESPTPGLEQKTPGLTQKEEDNDESDFTGEVFGATESSEASESADEQKDKEKFKPSLPLIISLIGVIFLGTSSFPFLKPKIKKIIIQLKTRR